MEPKEKILTYLKTNKNRLLKEYHLTKIGIFGSIALDIYSDNSDIDLLVEFEDNVSDLYTIKNKIRKEMQNKFNRPVDICREKYIKNIFKEQIISETIYV